MSNLFESWSDDQLGSLSAYMMNSDVDPERYNEIEEIMEEIIEEMTNRGMIREEGENQ